MSTRAIEADRLKVLENLADLVGADVREMADVISMNITVDNINGRVDFDYAFKPEKSADSITLDTYSLKCKAEWED